VTLGPGQAQASGYLTARFGSDHGTPAAPNPYAVYYNPAAMGGVKGTQIVADLAVVLRYVTYERSQNALSPASPAQLNDPNYVRANTGKAELANVLPLPYLGVVSDLGTKGLRVGYAFYIPFGGMAKWEQRDAWANNAYAPGAVDGPQRWHNISGQILAIYNTAALAYQISPQFSVGANVSAVYHHAETVRARTFDSSDDVRSPNGALKEGRSYLNVKGLNLSAALGVYWTPNDKVKLGLSYTSQPGFGTTRMKGTLENQFGSDAQRAQVTEVDFLQTYPDIVRFGAGFRVSQRAEVRFDADFVRWSVFKSQCLVNRGAECELDANGNQTNGQVVLNIPREWKNAIGIRLGGAYWVTDELELFGSVSLTTSAVPKTTIDASTIDSTRIYGALGARYEFSKTFALAGSYIPIYFVPVDTKGASKHDNYGSTSRSPSADGTYKSFIHMFNLNATVSF
jgi:long-chain fatty acid transport protein